MAKIFITGSADGLGQMAARLLVKQQHEVVLHARNEKRLQEALAAVPGATSGISGDLSSIEETKQVAEKANALGRFDAVIHNAGVYQVAGNLILKINVLAPYLLTCLIQKPERLIYLSSSMHLQGNLKWLDKQNDSITYSDSKLYDVLLAKAVARLWLDVYANAVDPGWVPTKMGGAGAPDNLEKGYATQAWLAASMDQEALVSGQYFYHRQKQRNHPAAADTAVQDRFLKACEMITGVAFPGA